MLIDGPRSILLQNSLSEIDVLTLASSPLLILTDKQMQRTDSDAYDIIAWALYVTYHDVFQRVGKGSGSSSDLKNVFRLLYLVQCWTDESSGSGMVR